MTIRRGGSTRCARCAGVASGCVRRMRPSRGTAGTDALVDLAAGMMIFRVSPQAPRVAIRLAATFGLALIRLLVPMRQHVPVPARKVAIRSFNRRSNVCFTRDSCLVILASHHRCQIGI